MTMRPIEVMALFLMVVFAIYKQTRVTEVTKAGRFKMALTYAGIAVLALFVSGWSAPSGIGWVVLSGGVVLSAAAGVVRGLLTRVWVSSEGKLLRQGTWLTVSIFIVVILAKVTASVWAVFAGVADGSSFAEILMIVSVMIAVQGEIVYRRALALSVPETAGIPAIATAS